MNIRSGILALFILLLPCTSRAGELKSETVKAWDEYIQAVNSQMRDRLNQSGPFLRVEETPDRASSVLHGQILVEPVANDGRHRVPYGQHEVPYGQHEVPYGLIHDWYGAVFVPGAMIEDVLAVLSDYDRYQEFYRPTVVNSKLLERTDDADRFSLLMLSKFLFVTVALDGQYQSQLTCVDEKRCYIISFSVRTQQVKDYGRPGERTLAPDEGDGYLWRLYAISRFEERDGGVLIENESIALSRDIPASVRWLVNPIVNRLPRNSISIALRQTRDAVSAAAQLDSRRTVMGRLDSRISGPPRQ
jgi:hypothetical protein